MQLNEVSKISELAKSLYQHRLVGSMEEAAKLAEQMIGQDKSGEKMSAQSAEKEIPADEDDDYPEIVPPEVNAPLESDALETDSLKSNSLDSDTLDQVEGPEQLKEERTAQPEALADEWLDTEEEEETVSEETAPTKPADISPIDLSEELEGVKLTTEGAEHVLEDLGKEVKSLKEQLEANTKEFEEIREYLKDIEAIAANSKEAKKKEQAGLKTSEIADKPATEIDGKLDL